MPTWRAPDGLHALDRERDPAPFASAVLPLVHESARAYFDWLFGGADAALRLLSCWMARSSSEVALQRVTVLVEWDAVAGAYIALSGADLVTCRKADSFALLSNVESTGREALVERLLAVRSLFAPVGDDEWYLSKLGVAPEARRQGVGGRLFEAYLKSGENDAFRRYRLDVDAANEPAIRLYESHGFRVIHDATSEAAGIRYLGMVMEA